MLCCSVLNEEDLLDFKLNINRDYKVYVEANVLRRTISMYNRILLSMTIPLSLYNSLCSSRCNHRCNNKDMLDMSMLIIFVIPLIPRLWYTHIRMEMLQKRGIFTHIEFVFVFHINILKYCCQKRYNDVVNDLMFLTNINQKS
jgi:hypothetical protein